ncbi:helix-turn-helix domain-containing protein, partial [Streptomyces sp. NPDC051133]|uniref:helix-turn-helix domain-containing protein n=1 Tax=Streptomyces sp. NPDC051133 TaxID=3155521 RepID=UPI00341F6390
MPTEDELFAAVDALLAGEPEMPGPAERARLREAAGITQTRLAQVLQTTTQTVKNWEVGRSEPRPPRRQAYQRLLDGWAERFPAGHDSAARDSVAPQTFTNQATPAENAPPTGLALDAVASPENTQTAPAPAAAERAAPPRPAPTTRSTSTSRRPATVKADPANTSAGSADPRFENGPLAVIDVDADGQVLAYCVGGLVLDVPAKSIPALVDWTLKEAKLGQPKLSGPGKDCDPLLVLT